MFLYFAYGSNMLTERLAARCPSARVVGPARAEGHRLSFDKTGHGPSGKATLLPASGDVVPGVLFEVAIAERGQLDEAEGPGYARIEAFAVIDGRGEERVAMTYLAHPHYLDRGLKPVDWYKALVVAGATQHGLDFAHREAIRTIEAIPDPEPDHPRRRAAIAALRAAGFMHLVTETA